MRTPTPDPRLRSKLADLRDQLDLREHDLDRLLDDDEHWLHSLLQILDSGLIQIARNMIFARLTERFGAEGADG